MKAFKAIIAIGLIISISCSQKLYITNGETIYKTGKSLAGKKMIDRKASSIPIINNCNTCHGKNGDAMKKVSIKFRDLSDPKKHTVPYNESLFYRFLDDDLKSDGSKANIGVIWKMSNEDKKDLLAYLKSL